MSTEIHDSRGALVLPRLITHMGDGSTALTNRDMTADIYACRVALESLTGSYRPRMALRTDGTNMVWADEGTALTAGQTVTLLSVSGYGGLHDFYIGVKDYTSWVKAVVVLDGNDLMGGSRPSMSDTLSSFLGTGANGGIIHHLQTLTSPTRHAYVYHLGNNGFGRFAASALVQITNMHATDDRKVTSCLFYALGASVEYTEPMAMEIEPSDVRRELANKLGFDEDDVTVALAYRWDEKLNRNVPSVTTLVHRRTLPPSAEVEVKKVMTALRAMEGVR